MCTLAKQPLVLNITSKLACNMHAQLALHSPGVVGLYVFIVVFAIVIPMNLIAKPFGVFFLSRTVCFESILICPSLQYLDTNLAMLLP